MHFLFIYILLFFSSTVFAKDYFVNSFSGNDSNSGFSEEHAWKSLEKINQFEFKPGDTIFLMPNAEFFGQFKPTVSGKKDAPITLTAFHSDKGLPKIQAEGEFLSLIHI